MVGLLDGLGIEQLFFFFFNDTASTEIYTTRRLSGEISKAYHF